MKGASVSLFKILEKYDKVRVGRFLSTFKCTKDSDLEEFLHEKAIIYEERGRSRTYLILDPDHENRILAYYTLSLTEIMVPKENSLSNTTVRRMDLDDGKTVGYLIGQLAKDDSVEEHVGHDLIDMAIGKLHVSFMQNGGRVICIDCKGPLLDFYKNEGFTLVEPEPNRKNGLYRLLRLF